MEADGAADPWSYGFSMQSMGRNRRANGYRIGYRFELYFSQKYS